MQRRCKLSVLVHDERIHMPTVLYAYDPLDRLIQTAGIRRFYNRSRMTTEIEGAVQRSVFQVGDHVLAEGGAGGSNLLATDLQRSVLHTVNPDKTQPIAYSVYGHRPAESGVASVLGFNGERADPVTGHYLLGNGYRAFNPVLMRFNSPDSWSPFGKGGINAYGYCGGDPANQVDSLGHASYFFKMLNGVRTIIPKVSYSGAKKGYVKLSEFTELLPSVLAAKERLKDGNIRLVINGHSSKGRMVYGADNRALSIEKLVASIEDSGLDDYSSIRLISCKTAMGAESSYAQQLSTAIGLPVKGYVNNVMTLYSLKQIKVLFEHRYGVPLGKMDGVYVPKEEFVLKSRVNVPKGQENSFQSFKSKVFNPIRET